MFLPLSVCLSDCPLDYSKSYIGWIFWWWGVAQGTIAILNETNGDGDNVRVDNNLFRSAVKLLREDWIVATVETSRRRMALRTSQHQRLTTTLPTPVRTVKTAPWLKKADIVKTVPLLDSTLHRTSASIYRTVAIFHRRSSVCGL